MIPHTSCEPDSSCTRKTDSVLKPFARNSGRTDELSLNLAILHAVFVQTAVLHHDSKAVSVHQDLGIR